MLRDIDAACVAIALAIFKKKKITNGPKNDTNEDHNTHESFIPRLKVV
jgi:hypothetical protein